MDLCQVARLMAAMNDDRELIRLLCTRVGTIMGDSSVEALLWSDGLTTSQRLERLGIASAKIKALLEAASVLVAE